MNLPVNKIQSPDEIQYHSSVSKTNIWREYVPTDDATEIKNNIELHSGNLLFEREDQNRYTNNNLNDIWHEACNMKLVKRLELK